MKNFEVDTPTVSRIALELITENAIDHEMATYQFLYTELGDAIEIAFMNLSPSERSAIFTETLYKTSDEAELERILELWMITKNVTPQELGAEIIMFHIWCILRDSRRPISADDYLTKHLASNARQ